MLLSHIRDNTTHLPGLTRYPMSPCWNPHQLHLVVGTFLIPNLILKILHLVSMGTHQVFPPGTQYNTVTLH